MLKNLLTDSYNINNHMDYHKIYKSLINKCKTRIILNEYTEKHHIIPLCIKGPDTADNIVELTAREHFIAHLLLAKMYPNTGLIHALNMMSNFKKYNSKEYHWIRIAHAKECQRLKKVFQCQRLLRESFVKTRKEEKRYLILLKVYLRQKTI